MPHKTLIIGPPGTGKTHHGIQLVKDALAKGTLPQRILYTSFTRSAAQESRDRALAAFPQYSSDDFKYFRTLHSIGFRLLQLNHNSIFDGHKLKEFAKTFNYQFSRDTLDKDIFQQEIIDMGLGSEADAYLAFDEWRKNKLYFSLDLMGLDFKHAYNEFIQQHGEIHSQFNEQGLRAFIQRKEEYKQKEGLWEFSDILAKVLMDEIPLDVDVVIADEHQDASPLIHAVIDLWSKQAQEVYLIGDPDQAIYSFMAADPSIMIDWERDEDIVLKQSYRCSQAVHDLSRKITDRMKVRYHSDFLPTSSLGQVIRTYTPNYDSAGSTIVAARTRYLLQKHYDELIRLSLPFTTRRGEKSPLDRKEKDIVLTLYYLVNGEQVSFDDIYRLSEVVPQKHWLEYGAKAQIKEMASREPSRKLSKASLPALGFTQDFMSVLNDRDFLAPLKLEEGTKLYFRRLISKYDIQGLIEPPKLSIGTCHSFKGLEADKVILDLELTTRPLENLDVNPDSEHRVMFVGVTRAREEIQLLIPDSWKAYNL
jgi:DNA helicase-2/ATP-dependent DNA helicase PcrA